MVMPPRSPLALQKGGFSPCVSLEKRRSAQKLWTWQMSLFSPCLNALLIPYTAAKKVSWPFFGHSFKKSHFHFDRGDKEIWRRRLRRKTSSPFSNDGQDLLLSLSLTTDRPTENWERIKRNEKSDRQNRSISRFESRRTVCHFLPPSIHFYLFPLTLTYIWMNALLPLLQFASRTTDLGRILVLMFLI